LREEFRDRLIQIPGVEIPDDKLGMYARFDATKLAADENFRRFTEAFE
jgi:hypothetical protein